MRRALLVALVVAAAAVVAVTVALVRRGGDEDRTVATVGRQRISQHQLELTVEHFREEAGAENHPFPKAGTREYRVVQRQSLGLLLYRARLAEAARRLGVHVSRAMVQRRVAATGSDETEGDAESEAEAARAFLRSTIRAQLLTEAVSARLTAPVRVSPAAVRAYYDAHRAIYGAASYTVVRRVIRAQLLASRRNAVMARWLQRARRLPAHVRDAELR
jgi:hypothetical protein